RRQPGLRRRRERAAADAGGGRDLPAVPLRRAPRLLRGRLMRPRNAWLTHALLIVACFVVMAPVLFALIKATQSYSDVLSPSLVPGRELLDNISAAWTNARLAIFMRNSLFVAAVVTLGKTLTALLAGLEIGRASV